MTKQDIDNIISVLCPNDEDFEKPIISPAYLKKELEALALEQEPCEDCISRQAVLNLPRKALKNYFGEVTAEVIYVRDVMELPSVTPQTRWIPVSERLPNDRDWYLGIFKESDTGWINPLPFICDYVGKATKATTKEHWILRGFTDRGELIDYYFNLECVAWMPIPAYENKEDN